MKAMVVVLFLVGSAPARADVRQLRQATAMRSELPVATPRVVVLEPRVRANVFDPAVRADQLRSIAEDQEAVLPDPIKPLEKKPWRARISVLPMGSMAKGTGSKGVKLKIRF